MSDYQPDVRAGDFVVEHSLHIRRVVRITPARWYLDDGTYTEKRVGVLYAGDEATAIALEAELRSIRLAKDQAVAVAAERFRAARKAALEKARGQ